MNTESKFKLEQWTFELTDEEDLSTRKKKSVIRAWYRFLTTAFDEKYFVQQLYDFLIRNCEFRGRGGKGLFYRHHFRGGNNEQLAFLQQFDPKGLGNSVDYGETWWLQNPKSRDVVKAMRIISGVVGGELRLDILQKIRVKDIEDARELLEKHGIRTAGLIPEWPTAPLAAKPAAEDGWSPAK